MNNRCTYIIIVLLCLLQDNVFSQINCITDPPLPPALTSVSVESETGNTRLTWTLSPSSDIAAYILYSYNNGDGMPIDTVWDPTATSYTWSTTVTKYFSVSYVVAAMRLPRCTSIFSNILNSIFEEVVIDTCLKSIIISWNSYPSIPETVTGYSILMSVNGGSYVESTETGADETTFNLNDFTFDAEYCFVVRANLTNGKFSTSNKNCIITKMQRPPQWINADQATLNSEGRVVISFTIDPLSEINHFSLQKRIGSSGAFEEISKPVSVAGSVFYTDSQAETNIVNYYRLSAVNNCNIKVLESNIASNIVLSLERSENNLLLSWNPYKNWQGIISSYRLFINSGRGFEEKAVITASDTLFILDYNQIMYEVSGDEVCFYVSATEMSNPYGVSGESVSSAVCTGPTELVTIPDVFTPNNDLKNDLFRPVLSFTPPDYHFIISDRSGRVLFETRDYLEEWDGSRNGNPEPQGVYLWFLKVTTPSGKAISRTGIVTIVDNR